MAEPTTSAAAGFGIAAGSVPMITLAGIHLGLRVDVLMAGFAGALVAMMLLPQQEKGPEEQPLPREWRAALWWLAAIIWSTVRRMTYALSSSMAAGYLAPALAPEAASLTGLMALSFIIGTSAQTALKLAIERWLPKGTPA